MGYPDGHVLCCISPTPLSVADAVKFVSSPDAGGMALFVGTARSSSTVRLDSRVLRLEYEVYVPMAESVLQEIAAETLRSHAIERVALMHRGGTVELGQEAII